MLDSEHKIDAIYLDFRKAFESVPNIRLSSNLLSYCLVDSREDTTILQNDLDCQKSWSAKWLLNSIFINARLCIS